jgi:hypothetical protein
LTMTTLPRSSDMFSGGELNQVLMLLKFGA